MFIVFALIPDLDVTAVLVAVVLAKEVEHVLADVHSIELIEVHLQQGHDVGKIGVRDNILLKPGKLDADEFEIMKTHVSHGLDIVSRSEWLLDAVDVVGRHHEKYDGSGYGRHKPGSAGVKGEAIPVAARIFAIADVFDALTSKRPYKEPFSFEKSIEILLEGSGSHFDPVLLKTFIQIARPLYDKLSGHDDDVPPKELETIIDVYFSQNTASLIQ